MINVNPPNLNPMLQAIELPASLNGIFDNIFIHVSLKLTLPICTPAWPTWRETTSRILPPAGILADHLGWMAFTDRNWSARELGTLKGEYEEEFDFAGFLSSCHRHRRLVAMPAQTNLLLE
jgi:hypothetical protein